ncbi:MAG: hypothetical protein IPP29_09045 [Bacteroidetes bacterium]|nr:hypothetical protein [Bacteroidota bacterium]
MKNIFKILITCLLYSNTYFGQGWSWSKHIGSSANDMALHASDSSDNLYVITNFFGSYCYSPGDTSTFCKGKNDLFLNKYNSAGVLIWSKQFGENNLNNCLKVLVQ